MNTIQQYKPELINKLQLWVTNMSTKGHTKYYEIFVDDVRVTHKTDDPEEFAEHKHWIDEYTKQVRVLIYNTKGSHRSQVFEFRTDKYVKEIDKEELLEIAQKQNEVLLSRIKDAEQYINKLEAELDEKSKNSGFDLEKILSFAKPLIQQNPQLAENLGISGLLGPNSHDNGTKGQKASEECEVTFKRKDEPQSNSNTPDTAENIVTDDPEAAILNQAKEKLNAIQFRELLELISFFMNNPGYINEVLKLVKIENASIWSRTRLF